MRFSVRAVTALALITGVLFVEVLFVGVAPAQAGHANVGERETVCAVDLAVRTSPGGAWLGTLYRGQTFYVREVHGSWVYGFAYGHINHHGWVQNGWFYPLPCSGP